MKKLFSSLYFQVLVFSIVVGAMLGCGSWFGGRQKDAASAQTANTNTRLVPLDSLLVKKECYSMEVLGRLAFKNDTLLRCIYRFDTSANKCRLRPDLTFETAFTKPEFKQFFNIPPDFTVEHWKDIQGHPHHWMFYKGIRIDYHDPIGFVTDSTGCNRGARIEYFYPKGEPENIQVSPEVAIDSAVAYY
ncbi:MAG TPA: hypothetical protein PK239_17545, partial [Chitinophagales bacterium]|nr:hypothetical protein [Chitinophagales bacterium]